MDKSNRITTWSSKTLSSSCLDIKADKEKQVREEWFFFFFKKTLFAFCRIDQLLCSRSKMAFPTYNNKTGSCLSKTTDYVI